MSGIIELWWPRNGRVLLNPVGISSNGRGAPGLGNGIFGNICGGCNWCMTSDVFGPLKGFGRFEQSGDVNAGPGPNKLSERESIDVCESSIDLSKIERLSKHDVYLVTIDSKINNWKND